jgi:hypothetical protein
VISVSFATKRDTIRYCTIQYGTVPYYTVRYLAGRAGKGRIWAGQKVNGTFCVRERASANVWKPPLLNLWCKRIVAVEMSDRVMLAQSIEELADCQ